MKKGNKFLVAITLTAILVGGFGLTGCSNQEKKENSSSQKTSESKEQTKSNEEVKNQEKEIEKYKIKSGTYQVGKDLPAGEYKLIADGENAFFKNTKDNTDDFGNVLTSSFFNKYTYIIVEDGTFLSFKHSYAIPADKSIKANETKASHDLHKVGVDIAAGEYKLSTTRKDTTSYAVYSKPHDLKYCLESDIIKNGKKITLKEGQYLGLPPESTAELVK